MMTGSWQGRLRRTVHFSGTVQGVGFRYTTRMIAAGFSVTGFVQNLDDGRVQLVVEGQKSDVEDFLFAVRSHMREYIADVESQDDAPTSEFHDFSVRH